MTVTPKHFAYVKKSDLLLPEMEKLIPSKERVKVKKYFKIPIDNKKPKKANQDGQLEMLGWND